MYKLVSSCGLMLVLTSCASSTVAPTYTSTMSDVLQIGGNKPVDAEAKFVPAGSYCLEISEGWKEDGKTPDDQKIWTKDTQRRVVPCK